MIYVVVIGFCVGEGKGRETSQSRKRGLIAGFGILSLSFGSCVRFSLVLLLLLSVYIYIFLKK